jgi:hypothetical protein
VAFVPDGSGCVIASATRNPTSASMLTYVCPGAQPLLLPGHTLDQLGKLRVLTVNGTPHVIHSYDNNLHDLTPDAGETTITPNNVLGNAYDAAVDGAGNLHVAYADCNNPHQTRVPSQLQYGKKTASGWTFEVVPVDYVSQHEQNISIATDLQGNPWIAFFKDDGETTGGLEVAHKSGGAWQVESVDTAASFLGNVVLRFTSTGQPRLAYHVSYIDEYGGSRGLRYAWRSSNAWLYQTEFSAIAVPRVDTFILDALDQPHIFGCIGSNGGVGHNHY